MKNSMFSSNKPVFKTKVNLQADYVHEATDGLDSLQPKEVVLNGAELEAIKKQIKSDESDEEEELKKRIEQKISSTPETAADAGNDDFIPLKTRSLRSVLRQRNSAYLSDSDSSPPDEEVQRGDDRLVRSAGAAPAEEEASDASLDSSDEEVKWEQHLVSRGLSGPAVAAAQVQGITHGAGGADLSRVAGPAEQFAVVSYEHVMRRLETALNELRVDFEEVRAAGGGEP